MREDEKQKLKNRESRYISIGITEGGKPIGALGIPWESTAQAYNMRTPNVHIAPEDLEDEEIMNMLMAYEVIGCYIWEPLNDYTWISRFKELEDLSIMNGDSIRELTFMENLDKCRMLLLHNAKLENLDTVLELNQKAKISSERLKCVALYNCEVHDLSSFEIKRHYFVEFLVWESGKNKGSKRWNVVNASTRKYRKI